MKIARKFSVLSIATLILVSMEIFIPKSVINIVSIVVRYGNNKTISLRLFGLIAFVATIILCYWIMIGCISTINTIISMITKKSDKATLQSIARLIINSNDCIPCHKPLSIPVINNALNIKNCNNALELKYTSDSYIDIFIAKKRIVFYINSEDIDSAGNEVLHAIGKYKNYLHDIADELILVSKMYAYKYKKMLFDIEKYKYHFNNAYINKYYHEVLTALVQDVDNTAKENYLKSYNTKSVSAAYIFLKNVNPQYDNKEIIHVLQYIIKSGITREIAEYFIKFNITREIIDDLLHKYNDNSIEKMWILLIINNNNKNYDTAKQNILSIIEQYISDASDRTQDIVGFIIKNDRLYLNDNDILTSLRKYYDNQNA